MDKISLERVCRQIANRQAGAIEYALQNGMEIFPYSRQDFEMDMLADGFISSFTTVTAKWRMLEASGVITIRGDRAFLSVPEVRAKTGIARKKVAA